MNTDFIGDLHGHNQLLEKLLVKLDYEIVNGVYRHPIQKTIFIGDLINHGPNVKQVLKLIYKMYNAGQARCILGNHEINLIAYKLHRKKSFLTNIQVQKIEKQIEATVKSFKNDWTKLNFYIDWIKEFPAFIEENNFRSVHACWIQNGIDFIKKNSDKNILSDEVIIKLMNVSTKEYGVLHSLFKGIDIPILNNGTITSNEKAVRIRWWDSMKNKTYRQLATKERDRIPDLPIPDGIITKSYKYSEESRLLFVGHYCLDEIPHLVSKNVCCLDFCVTRKGILTTYRLLAEKKLKPEHLYFVKH